MEFRNKEHKNRFKVNARPIISLLVGLGFVSAVFAATVLAASQKANNQQSNNVNLQANGDQDTFTETSDTAMIAVVKEIESENKQITLFDIDRQEAIVLSYSGGTNITDKYGKVISMSQITIGSMVDAAYKQGNNKLISMNISAKAWEYADVNNMNINRTDNIIKIASTKYKYTDGIIILDGQEFVSIDDLAEQDQLTVWGYEETIWSVIVTKGHGTVKLKDYEDYMGNFVTIGYESALQITDDMEVTVREGDFNLTVENGLYSATKPVTVNRNEVTYVSLSDLGPNGLKQSQVTFEITPYGADLYIDGKLTSYSDPVNLSYGKHSIRASLGGYNSYEGTIDVDSSGKTIKIDLPEATSEEAAVVTETDTNSGTDSDSTDASNTDSNSTDTDNSDTDSNTTDNSSEGTADTSDDQTVDQKHKIYIQSPSGASVYLDGDYVGTAPCNFDKVIGSLVLTFIQDGYETMSYTVDVSDDNLDAYFTFPSLTEK